MRLQELFESSEEDRAIISLSHAIYAKIENLSEPAKLGKIGDLFDTPISALNDVNLELVDSDTMSRRAETSAAADVAKVTDNPGIIIALWDGDSETIVLNIDYIDHERIKSSITHELRHALDDVKSGYEAGASSRYSTPRNKEHRKPDPYSTLAYRAQPAEINARFSEVLHTLAGSIKVGYKRFPPDQLRPKIVQYFNALLKKYEIADIFPERTASPQYKRLVKRGMDFIQKEMNYIEQTSDKKATGNW